MTELNGNAIASEDGKSADTKIEEHESSLPIVGMESNSSDIRIEVELNDPLSVSLNGGNPSPSSSLLAKKDHSAEAFVFMAPDEGTPAAEALAANAAIKVSKVSKGIKKLRGGLKGTPNIKNLNIVRRIRKHTKRGRKKNHFSRNFKGKVIDGVHELYTLTAGMILGIRGAVSWTETQDHALTLDDFSHVDKQVFPAKGNDKGPRITPPHSLVHTFKFKSYAPKVFGRIREFFNIDVNSYMTSVCGNYNFLEFIANSKSGQFFFYSHDGKYMIKTQTKEENKFMRRILPHYFKYVSENPHTFLVKIVDMHRVKMYHLNRKVHFVIMTSVFDTPEKIHTIYDLKGSMIGRKVKDKDKEANPGAVLKDVNFIEDKIKLQLGPKKDAFIRQLKLDAEFLAGLNIMDYSLLVGIHYRNRRTPTDIEFEQQPVVDPASKSKATRDTIHVIRSNTPFRQNMNNNPKAPLTSQISTQTIGNSEDNDSRVDERSNGVLVDGVVGIGVVKSNSRRSVDAHVSPPLIGGIDSSPSAAAAAIPPLNLPSPLSLAAPDSDNHDPNLPPKPPLQSSPSKRLSKRNSVSNRQSGGNRKSLVLATTLEEANDSARSNLSPKSDDHRTSLQDNSTPRMGDDGLPTSSPLALDSGRLTSEEIDDNEDDDMFDDDDMLYDEDEDDDDGDSFLGDEPYESLNSPESLNVLEGASTPTADHLSKIFRQPAPVIQRITSRSDTNSPAVFLHGPSATKRHPWTGRQDNGINCRVMTSPTADERGYEIYYCGIIDILQQYNNGKKLENFFKGFQYDRTQISAVDAPSYAKRFVKFIEDNSV